METPVLTAIAWTGIADTLEALVRADNRIEFSKASAESTAMRDVSDAR
jgi:hypothetical protein